MGNVRSSERLITACSDGNLQNVKKELEKGADPNYKDSYDRTPLIRAVYSSNKNNII